MQLVETYTCVQNLGFFLKILIRILNVILTSIRIRDFPAVGLEEKIGKVVIS